MAKLFTDALENYFLMVEAVKEHEGNGDMREHFQDRLEDAKDELNSFFPKPR